MDRNEVIERAAGELTVGLDGAAQYVYDWVEGHPEEALKPLCKQVAEKAGIPNSWEALEKRVVRKRQKALNQADDGKTTSHWTDAPQHKRTTKAVLREAEPEEIAEMLSDPKIAANVAKAAVVSEQQKQRSEQTRQKKDAPALVHRFGFSDVVGELFKAKRSYATALNAIRELDLDTEEIEAITELVGEIDLVREWFQSFLDSGSSDFDTELEKLLAEGV